MSSSGIQQFALARCLCDRYPGCNNYYREYVYTKEETVETFNKKMLVMLGFGKEKKDNEE